VEQEMIGMEVPRSLAVIFVGGIGVLFMMAAYKYLSLFRPKEST